MNSDRKQPKKDVLKSFRMESGLAEEIQKIAERENRNVSNVINTLLKKGLNYGKGSSASI